MLYVARGDIDTRGEAQQCPPCLLWGNRDAPVVREMRHHHHTATPREVKWNSYWKRHFSYAPNRRNDLVDHAMSNWDDSGV
jgi:hypothetical protein